MLKFDPDVTALNTRVKFQGTFDFKDFYRALRDVVKDKGFISGDHDQARKEKLYFEKRTQEPRDADSGWIWWRTWKIEEGSTTFMQYIDIDMHLRYIKSVELMEQGRKIKAKNGEIEIALRSGLMLDPYGEWGEHWFLKHIRYLYFTRIFGKRKDVMESRTRNDCYFIQRFIKDFFELRQFVPTPQSFYRPSGYKLSGYGHPL